MSRKKPWLNPIVFKEAHGTMTKAEYDLRVEEVGRPPSWKKTADYATIPGVLRPVMEIYVPHQSANPRKWKDKNRKKKVEE